MGWSRDGWPQRLSLADSSWWLLYHGWGNALSTRLSSGWFWLQWSSLGRLGRWLCWWLNWSKSRSWGRVFRRRSFLDRWNHRQWSLFDCLTLTLFRNFFDWSFFLLSLDNILRLNFVIILNVNVDVLVLWIWQLLVRYRITYIDSNIWLALFGYQRAFLWKLCRFYGGTFRGFLSLFTYFLWGFFHSRLRGWRLRHQGGSLWRSAFWKKPKVGLCWSSFWSRFKDLRKWV